MPTQTESTAYGYRSTISDVLPEAEAKAWFEDVKRAVGTRSNFGQLIDLRRQKPYGPETNAVIQEAMTYVRAKGMVRSAVVLSSAVTALQIKRLAKETGMYEYERYIDASADPNWEQTALAWIERGIDPDA